jgi:hypothetical protein
MVHKHDADIPVPLDTFLTRLGDLEVVLGKDVAPLLAGIRQTVIAAMAARDRGDVPGAVDRIGQAMDRLTALADKLDPAEAVLMRALAQNFRTALKRGDQTQAQQSAAVMFEKSGATERKKN